MLGVLFGLQQVCLLAQEQQHSSRLWFPSGPFGTTVQADRPPGDLSCDAHYGHVQVAAATAAAAVE